MATFSDILLHTQERWGVKGELWLEVWHQLLSYVIHGGFPRTWYSGNHWCGRASQLGTGAHILATGIPEVHCLLISSSARPTPMHPRCPHWVAGEWLDPGLMVSLFLGGLGHILASCECPLGQCRGVTYCGCLVTLWYVLLSKGWGHVLLLFTTQRSWVACDVICSLFEGVHVTLRPSVCLSQKYNNKQCLHMWPLAFTPECVSRHVDSRWL